MTDTTTKPTGADELKARAADLETKLAALAARIAELEKAGGSPPVPVKSDYAPIDYTRGASMDRETMREMASAIPDSLARELRADVARGLPVTAGTSQLSQNAGRGEHVVRGSGWAKENKIESPPGIKLADAMLDRQDEIDRADLARRLSRSAREKG